MFRCHMMTGKNLLKVGYKEITDLLHVSTVPMAEQLMCMPCGWESEVQILGWLNHT